MSGKNVMWLLTGAFVLELAILVIFGAVGKNGGKDLETWFTLGPVAVQRHGMELEPIGRVEKYNLQKAGTTEGGGFWSIDIKTTQMMLVVDAIMILSALGIRSRMRKVPQRLQGFMEIVVDFFGSIVKDTLGKHAARHMPTLLTLFFFIWISNLMGIIPFLEEPTVDLNVTFGLMMVMLFIVHFEAIRLKGFREYSKEYFQPFFIMFPLNVIGEFAKGVSLSFRLFGNICGGAIIIMVISYLVKYTLLPVGLDMFFGLFVGTIQAFVFTMLSMTYIAVAISESE